MIMDRISYAGNGPSTECQDHILLINRPEAWFGPDVKAKRKVMEWAAGRRLAVADTRCDASGKPYWFKVAGEGSACWLPAPYLASAARIQAPDHAGIIGNEVVDSKHGLPPEYAPTDLAPVGPGQDKDVNYRLRQQAAQSLKSLIQAAREDGVKLLIVSAYRPWAKQQELYERRLRETGLEQQTVAKPGHSEHQLGTAVDFTDGNEETQLKESFGQTKAGQWLRENAWKYGFAISFTRHNQPGTGIAPEPWHYRYWGLGQARSRHLQALGEAK